MYAQMNGNKTMKIIVYEVLTEIQHFTKSLQHWWTVEFSYNVVFSEQIYPIYIYVSYLFCFFYISCVFSM